MKYQITKKQCEKRIKELGNVCDFCGRELQALKTKDNAGQLTHWIGCHHGSDCGHFTHGCKKEMFDLAVKMTLEDSYSLKTVKYDSYDNFDMCFEEANRRNVGILQTLHYLASNEPRYTKEELNKRFGDYKNL